MVRTKTFNFHSSRSGLITKLRNNISQSTTELDYKMDAGSDSNIMAINVFKTIFPRIAISELYK